VLSFQSDKQASVNAHSEANSMPPTSLWYFQSENKYLHIRKRSRREVTNRYLNFLIYIFLEKSFKIYVIQQKKILPFRRYLGKILKIIDAQVTKNLMNAVLLGLVC